MKYQWKRRLNRCQRYNHVPSMSEEPTLRIVYKAEFVIIILGYFRQWNRVPLYRHLIYLSIPNHIISARNCQRVRIHDIETNYTCALYMTSTSCKLWILSCEALIKIFPGTDLLLWDHFKYQCIYMRHRYMLSWRNLFNSICPH